MSQYPKSPKEVVGGMMYFPRMLDKIRLHAKGELGTDYHRNLGRSQAADGVCCKFLGIDHAELTSRVLEGGTDEEILEWCYQNGRRPLEVDLTLWNTFASKLGWRDFASETLERAKKEHGIEHRTDIMTIPDLIDFDEGRIS
jgi:hypothetical protein